MTQREGRWQSDSLGCPAWPASAHRAYYSDTLAPHVSSGLTCTSTQASSAANHHNIHQRQRSGCEASTTIQDKYYGFT
eukprot:scaffold16563_cov66-Phaeocystis_antarctica.AAC.1